MKILNFGSLNYDYVYSLPHIVTPGETIASTKMEIFCGGKGLNQSIALAKAGANVYHAGMVGEDGGELCSILSENGVKTEHVKQIPGKSGHAIIQGDQISKALEVAAKASSIAVSRPGAANSIPMLDEI